MYFSPTMQPNFCYGTGPQNTVQYIPFQPPVQNVQNPEIIGEGDLTSIILPNGSVQYFFIPTIKRDVWAPCAFSPPTMNVNWNLASQAWFIRNISNPIAPSFCFGQQYLRPYGDPFNPNIMPSDCNTNTPALGYSNMFHYDRCTSTSDLRHFSPRVSSCHQQTSAVQIVSAPAPPHDPTCLYEVVCGKPCPCGVTSGTTKYCQDDSQKEPERVASAMSIEEMDRKDCCECPPKTKNVDKSVATIRESTSEEDSEEITIPEKTKVRETNKMKTLSKERSISKSKSKEKSSKIDRKPSPIEVIKKDKGSQHDTNIKKSSYQKLGKGEDSSSSEKEKVGSDELKPKKEGKGEKEKKKRVKCHCEEVSDDDNLKKNGTIINDSYRFRIH
ncbi:PREDICTED: uncharacterized protein LOC106104728 [Papilio polytes]|uniref:uncharacterized protein LOC106104728 n=1 Tax=Papilio polytes TaxID=76194 RepID=UPI0006769A73|nr:PREDICTED: uncharacterized protein LOC106104728 [Papilio polytes]